MPISTPINKDQPIKVTGDLLLIILSGNVTKWEFSYILNNSDALSRTTWYLMALLSHRAGYPDKFIAMKKLLYTSEREFRIWEYSASHSMLHIRSLKDKNNASNIDIIFSGVKYINLLKSITGLSIKFSDFENIKNMVPESIKHRTVHLFELISEHKAFYVYAFGFVIYENEMDFDSSALWTTDKLAKGKVIVDSTTIT